MMTIPTKLLLDNQRLIEAPYEVRSLEELSILEPDGIYTVARTHDGTKSVLLDAHADRLEESAALESIPLQLDRDILRAALRETLAAGGFENARFRITIPRETPDQILIAAEPLREVPAEIVHNGADVATNCIIRPNPSAKSNAWVSLRAEARKSLPDHVYEGLICTANGALLECFSSNFYAIKDGKLWTANQDVLFGIARKIVLEVVQGLLPIHFQPVMIEDLASLQETFLSSSGRGVVPIVRIDDCVIGESPGPFTLEIVHRYNTWVKENLEPI
ncbi:unnamed protein product [marine sediment metagenome]|uniref:Aminotransferase class IV n=1 Tax=marine sediment metagenome TaxID=412755 RepID=X0Z1A9_9ZZZZ